MIHQSRTIFFLSLCFFTFLYRDHRDNTGTQLTITFDFNGFFLLIATDSDQNSTTSDSYPVKSVKSRIHFNSILNV